MLSPNQLETALRAIALISEATLESAVHGAISELRSGSYPPTYIFSACRGTEVRACDLLAQSNWAQDAHCITLITAHAFGRLIRHTCAAAGVDPSEGNFQQVLQLLTANPAIEITVAASVLRSEVEVYEFGGL